MSEASQKTSRLLSKLQTEHQRAHHALDALGAPATDGARLDPRPLKLHERIAELGKQRTRARNAAHQIGAQLERAQRDAMGAIGAAAVGFSSGLGDAMRSAEKPAT